MSSICCACSKTVYLKEKIHILNRDWHKSCFKCTTCNMTLNAKNFESYNKMPYCRAHMVKAKASAVGEVPPPPSAGTTKVTTIQAVDRGDTNVIAAVSNAPPSIDFAPSEEGYDLSPTPQQEENNVVEYYE
eukprot:GEZU01019992.1.p1 GENE.GEZU01019992.1~~GEZU01019992.1.p1  ORF type:complete len:131 (-),score=25.36 GEZU01019992.1:73-465(-)